MLLVIQKKELLLKINKNNNFLISLAKRMVSNKSSSLALSQLLKKRKTL
jgi:hypothetical protein